MMNLLGISNISSLEECIESLLIGYRSINSSTIYKLHTLRDLFQDDKYINDLITHIHKYSYLTRNIIRSISDMITVMKYTNYYIILNLILLPLSLVISNGLSYLAISLLFHDGIYISLLFELISNAIINIFLLGYLSAYISESLSDSNNSNEIKQSILIASITELTSWIILPIYGLIKKAAFNNFLLDSLYSYLATTLYGISNVIISDLIYSKVDDIPFSITPDIVISSSVFSLLSFVRSDYLFHDKHINQIKELSDLNLGFSRREIRKISTGKSTVDLNFIKYKDKYNVEYDSIIDKVSITLETNPNLQFLKLPSEGEFDNIVMFIIKSYEGNLKYNIISLDKDLNILHNEEVEINESNFINKLQSLMDRVKVQNIDEDTFIEYIKQSLSSIVNKSVSLSYKDNFLYERSSDEYIKTVASIINNTNFNIHISSFEGMLDAFICMRDKHIHSDTFTIKYKLLDKVYDLLANIILTSYKKFMIEELEDSSKLIYKTLVGENKNLSEYWKSELNIYISNKKLFEEILNIPVDLNLFIMYRYFLEFIDTTNFVEDFDKFKKFIDLHISDYEIISILEYRNLLSTHNIYDIIESVLKSENTLSRINILDIIKSSSSVVDTNIFSTIESFYNNYELSISLSEERKNEIMYYYLLNEILILFNKKLYTI